MYKYTFIIYVWANEMYLGKKQDIFYTVVIIFLCIKIFIKYIFYTIFIKKILKDIENIKKYYLRKLS